MSFITTYPALLWILALVTVPILVHLFARSRPPSYAFSDTAFLKILLKKTARLRKPQDWLTLLLRTLACLALLLAILHPLLVARDPNAVAGAQNNIILVIDQSASMSARDGATTRFDKAISEASKLLNDLKPDKANIIWARASAKSEYPEPAPNLQFLHEALQNAESVNETSAGPSALSIAIGQLQKTQGSREIFLISDFQKNSWNGAQTALPDSIKLTKIKVASQTPNNVAVTELSCSPSSPIIGQDTLIRAKLSNFSDQNQHLSSYLNIAGSRQSKSIDIPAHGQVEVLFTASFSKSGQLPITVSIDEDTYPADDSRHLILDIDSGLQITSLERNPSASSETLDRVASALPWLKHSSVKNISKIGPADILFIHDWDGSNIKQLEQISQNTTLIVDPSISCGNAAIEELFSLKSPSSVINRSSNSDGWEATISDPSSPVFQLFASGEYGNPAAGVFHKRMDLPISWSNAEHITSFISYTDNTPAILSSNTATPRLLWNLPISPTDSSWALQEPFLPFIAELLLHIRPDSKLNEQEFLSGSPLFWSLPDEIDASSVTLQKDADAPSPTQVNRDDLSTVLLSEEPAAPGIFSWKIGNHVSHLNYVNFPSPESDLQTLTPDSLTFGQTLASEDVLRNDALSQGVPLWPYFLAAGILLLFAESFASTPQKITIAD